MHVSSSIGWPCPCMDSIEAFAHQERQLDPGPRCRGVHSVLGLEFAGLRLASGPPPPVRAVLGGRYMPTAFGGSLWLPSDGRFWKVSPRCRQAVCRTRDAPRLRLNSYPHSWQMTQDPQWPPNGAIAQRGGDLPEMLVRCTADGAQVTPPSALFEQHSA